MSDKIKPGHLKTYKGTLSLDWYGKDYGVVQGREDEDAPGLVPPPRLNWVNGEASAFYLPGDSKKPVWVHRGDIRLHEARPLVPQATWTAQPVPSPDTLGLDGDGGYTLAEVKGGPARQNTAGGNLLIKGDNLLALNTLKKDYAGQVKCIFIDPPYNTGQAFDKYDDNLEHSTWLSLMQDRLQILYQLLAEDGFICCQIDDVEGPYLKILLDKIFGRENHLVTFFIQVRYDNKTLAEDNDFQKVIEQCHVFVKNKQFARPIRDSEEYSIEKFEWKITELSVGQKLELGGKRVEVFRDGEYLIEKVAPSYTGLKETWATGSLVRQSGSSGEYLDKYLAPRKDIDGLSSLYKVYGIGEDGLGYRYMTGPKKVTASKGKFYSGIPLLTLEQLKNGNSSKGKPIGNFYDFAGAFGNCRQEGGVKFNGGKKPEVLIQLILKHFSNPGDLVLDSFGGSGTTGAVAHKMGRRWILVEQGDHCDTHIIPRLQKVITGQDQGGISQAVGWKGGGSFSYFHLGDSLLQVDAEGWADLNWAAGRTWLEGAILSAYDFRPLALGNEPVTAGLRQVKGGAEVAIVSLCAPGEPEARQMLGREEWEPLYAAAVQLGRRVFLFTNRGLELALDSKPDNLTVVRVPDALCTGS